MSECLLVNREDRAWTLTLNRPDKRNALNADLVESLIDAIGQAHAAGAELLVLRGQGKNFCAGFDFGGFEDTSEGDLLWRFVRIEQLLQMLNNSSALTVALAHGKNFGAGVDLMAACKHRVASVETSFQMPGLKFGLVLGTRRLAALVGTQRARQIQQVAQTLDSSAALAAGLVSEVVNDSGWASVLTQQHEAARTLSAQVRQSLYRVLRHDTDDADMADLVRSVVEPGLKQRIANYRASV